MMSVFQKGPLPLQVVRLGSLKNLLEISEKSGIIGDGLRDGLRHKVIVGWGIP
jgi:hypothetical protein